MDRRLLSFILLIIFLPFSNLKAGDGNVHKLNTEFSENKNQWYNHILFKANIPDGAIFLEKNCLTYAFMDGQQVNNLLSFKHLQPVRRNQKIPSNTQVDCHSYKVRFIGCNDHARAMGERPFTDYENYFIGNDPAHWASRVKKYSAIKYSELYQGINFEIFQQDGQLKYNFNLESGANPALIKLQFDGVRKIYLKNGNLVIKTTINTIQELKPVAWQVDSQ